MIGSFPSFAVRPLRFDRDHQNLDWLAMLREFTSGRHRLSAHLSVAKPIPPTPVRAKAGSFGALGHLLRFNRRLAISSKPSGGPRCAYERIPRGGFLSMKLRPIRPTGHPGAIKALARDPVVPGQGFWCGFTSGMKFHDACGGPSPSRPGSAAPAWPVRAAGRHPPAPGRAKVPSTSNWRPMPPGRCR